MSKDISILVQNYQGTFILDMLNEFRKDIVRCIFRDLVLPRDVPSRPAAHSQVARLNAFLVAGRPAEWTSSFQNWYGAECPREVMEVHIALHDLAVDFVARFQSATKAEIWGYLYSEEFSRALRISVDVGVAAERQKSIVGLFNVVAFSISAKERIAKLIQPLDITIQNLDRTLRVCFPLAKAETLDWLSANFSKKGFEHLPLCDEFDVKPSLFRGNTAVCYNTGYYSHLGDEYRAFGELSRLVYNNTFIQLRPLSHKDPVGFVQLQCCVPGLVEALIPPCLASGHKAILLGADGASAKQSCGSNEQGVVLVEFSDAWLERDKADKCLHTFWRIHELTAGWTRRLYNFLELNTKQAAKLEEELRKRDQQKYRQQLDLLQKPLREMMSAVTTFQRSSQAVGSVLYDPCESVLRAHHLIAECFEDGVKVKIWEGFEVAAMHEPNYPITPDGSKDARAMLACIFLRCLGKEGHALAQSERRFFVDARLTVDECGGDEVFRHDIALLHALVRSSKLELQCLGEAISPDAPVDGLNVGLRRLKAVLFTPFKPDTTGLNPLAIYICALSRKQDQPQPLMDIDGKQTSIECVDAGNTVGIVGSAFMAKDVLAFIISIRREAENRYTKGIPDPRFVRKVATIVTEEGRNAEIKLEFDESFIDADAGIKTLRARVDRIIGADQSWQIAIDNFGNFSLPFLRLATRLLGRGVQWEVDTDDTDSVFAIREIHGTGKFKISASGKTVTLNKSA